MRHYTSPFSFTTIRHISSIHGTVYGLVALYQTRGHQIWIIERGERYGRIAVKFGLARIEHCLRRIHYRGALLVTYHFRPREVVVNNLV